MKNGRPAAAVALTVALQFLFAASACGQTGVLPPNPVPIPKVEAPAIQSPLSPPSVTAPVLTAPVPPGTTATAAAGNAATAKASGTSASSAGKSVLPDTLEGLTSPVSLLNALSGSGTDGEGLDALSALLGGGTGGTSANGTSADSATLAKIAALLEKQQAGTAAAPKASGAEIVRFVVNRTDIVSTAAGVVSSTLAKDGSFLVTGRRPDLGETFYLVCKKTGTGKFRLFIDLTQDYINEKSWLYQLVRKSPIEGTLTGDLLVFRSVDPSWALDLVIRVIGPSVPAATVR